jgi:hypothetical protein
MLLSARALVDVASANSFEHSEVLEFTVGDAGDVYFQLVDASLDKSVHGYVPPGRRYIPASGATLQCTVESIDDAKKIVRYATAPFAGDQSIWKLSFLATDTIKGTANIRLKLTEPAGESSLIRQGVAKASLRIYSDTCL